MADHIKLGKEGEDQAAEYLISNGYTLLERNWRFSRAEIDLICKLEDVLVFVEVKTLSYNYFGDPADKVDERKEHLIIEAANQYMEQVNHQWAIRFDIISILKNKDGSLKLTHYPDAFF